MNRQLLILCQTKAIYIKKTGNVFWLGNIIWNPCFIMIPTQYFFRSGTSLDFMRVHYFLFSFSCLVIIWRKQDCGRQWLMNNQNGLFVCDTVVFKHFFQSQINVRPCFGPALITMASLSLFIIVGHIASGQQEDELGPQPGSQSFLP